MRKEEEFKRKKGLDRKGSNLEEKRSKKETWNSSRRREKKKGGMHGWRRIESKLMENGGNGTKKVRR